MHAEDRMDAWPLTCPVCDRSLSRADGAVSCSEGHSFDVAREGYVNLLPAQHRTRGIDGDLLGMLQARRSFLESGHYRPLLDELTTQVAGAPRERGSAAGDSAVRPCVLEVGCGEGYYIGSIAETSGGGGAPRMKWLGTDISKPAARLAAKHYPRATFFVADVNRRVCVQDASVSVLLDVFAPRNPSEFARIVEPGGCAIIVIPAEAHLESLRDRLGLLGIQEDKERLVVKRLEDKFKLVGRTDVRYPLTLTPQAVREVVRMGPNSWHRPLANADSEIGSESATEPFETQAAFVILRLERSGKGLG